MTLWEDFRWRAVVLVYVYHITEDHVSLIFGVPKQTLTRWMHRFESTGTVTASKTTFKKSRRT